MSRRSPRSKGGWIDPSLPREATPESPFASLAGLRAQLPASEDPPERADPDSAPTTNEPSARPSRRAVVRIERKGRGGKTVTRVERLGLAPVALAELARELRRALGSGGAVEGDDLVLQGDLRERVEAWLASRP